MSGLCFFGAVRIRPGHDSRLHGLCLAVAFCRQRRRKPRRSDRLTNRSASGGWNSHTVVTGFRRLSNQHAVWLYLRFTLSYRDVEDLLAERGLDHRVSLLLLTPPPSGYPDKAGWPRWQAFQTSTRCSDQALLPTF